LNDGSGGDFPVGPWTYAECGICLEVGWLNKRHCCDYCACIQCLQQYYSSRIELGAVTIECINPFCHSFVHRDEISARLTPQMKDVYHRLLLTTSSQSEQTKPCPQCNYFYTLSDDLFKQYKSKMKDSHIFRVQCTECQFFWCFKCHSPWHSELSCKQYRKGDRLLKTWAKETNHGQVNAQKCPRCAIYIQRTSGCDHMHCTRCKTDFCYKCGDRLRRLKFFGDHYSKLSIFGCKYRYKANQPLQRKLIRGAVFASKLMLVPILGSLAVCAGAVVLVLGVAALPLYGAVKIYRKYRNKKTLKNIRQQVVVSTISR